MSGLRVRGRIEVAAFSLQSIHVFWSEILLTRHRLVSIRVGARSPSARTAVVTVSSRPGHCAIIDLFEGDRCHWGKVRLMRKEYIDVSIVKEGASLLSWFILLSSRSHHVCVFDSNYINRAEAIGINDSSYHYASEAVPLLYFCFGETLWDRVML